MYFLLSGRVPFVDGSVMHKLKSHAQVEISGLVATTTLTQSFHNPTANWQESIYVFPLPENAAVNFMEVEVGERKIVATVKERQVAKLVYEKAKQDVEIRPIRVIRFIREYPANDADFANVANIL